MTLWTLSCQAPLSVDFLGKNTGVGFNFLLQGIFLAQGSNPCLLHWQVRFFTTKLPGKHTHIHTHTIHMCIHTHTCTHTIHMCIHTHACTHTIHMCIHTHACTHIHTNTHTHTHTHIPNNYRTEPAVVPKLGNISSDV